MTVTSIDFFKFQFETAITAIASSCIALPFPRIAFRVWLPATLVSEDIPSGRLAVAASEDWRIRLEIRLYCDTTPPGPAVEEFGKRFALPHRLSISVKTKSTPGRRIRSQKSSQNELLLQHTFAKSVVESQAADRENDDFMTVPRSRPG